MKEWKVVAEALTRITPKITYGQDEVRFTNPDNGKHSVAVSIPKDQMPNVKRFLSAFYKDPIDMDSCLKELEKIPHFLLQLADAIGNIDWMTSTPTEKKLKLASAVECLREKTEKARNRHYRESAKE